MERRKYLLGGCLFLFLISSAVEGGPDRLTFSADKAGKKVQKAGLQQTNYSPGSAADKWLGPDKFKHFLAGAFSTIFVYETCTDVRGMDHKEARVISISISSAISVGKEVLDARSPENHFCKKDLLFDILGIAAGLILVNHR